MTDLTDPRPLSDRPTDRVDHPAGERPGQGPAQAITGPESRDDCAPHGRRAERPGRRVSRGQLALVSRGLSERDRAVLQSLADYGLLRSGHLEALHFSQHATAAAAARTCRRVLRRLGDARLIEPIERRIGGIRAGSDGTVWRLGPSGDRLLRAAEPDAPRARRREPSLRFLEHRLLVADVACTLTRAAQRGELELLRVVPEPASWRRYGGLHGGRETLKPDLFAVTATGDYEDHWFIEVDRGTESLPTLLRQCVQYEAYQRSGREQQATGVFPRVLWLVPDAHRRDRLRAALRADSSAQTDLFRVHTFAELLAVIRGGAA